MMQFIRSSHLRICGAVGVLCLVAIFDCAYSLEWIVDDAVYITAEIETRSPDEESFPSSASGDEAGRLPGKCLKLKACYPIFFLTGEDKEGNEKHPVSTNSDLVDFILETTERCEPEAEQGSTETDIRRSRKQLLPTNSSSSKYDVYVWCRLRSPFNDTTKSTLSSPSSARQNSVIFPIKKAENEEPSCGQVSSKIPRTEDDISSTDSTGGERVVGGKEVKPAEAPYVVALLFRGKQVCGGSIIDDQHILTAAHCVSHLKPSVLQHLRLLIGDHDIRDTSDTDHQERNVSKIIYHKEFASDTLHDDIAMIKVSDSILYTSAVAPVCLSDGSPPFDDGTTLGKLVGWGQISDSGERPSIPRTAQLRIWKPEDCEEVYDDIVPEDVLEKAFCAGGFQDGGTTDACRGDSGGPMTIIRKDNRIEQIGIVSFGIGCGRYPGVFTRVSEYQSWIDRHRQPTRN